MGTNVCGFRRPLSAAAAARVNIDVTRWEGGGNGSDYRLIHADRGGGAARWEINI